MIQFTLPFPPSVNHYWRHISKGPAAGRVLISEEGRAYRTSCEAEVLRQRVPRHSLGGKLAVNIRAYMPDRRRRDLDNLLKSSLDALKHCGVIQDDGDIDELQVKRGPVEKGGVLLVTIREVVGL
jgi:crossover junction endodeoxyribonuclease RusA